MKVCSRCKVDKPRAAFGLNSKTVDGLCWYCRECRTAYNREWRANNGEKVKAIGARWKAAHPEKDSIRGQRWREANPEKAKAHHEQWNKKWRRENPEKYRALEAAKTAKRRALKRNATPSWLTADDHWLLTEAYALAKLRENICGGKWHVDHIVPLNGANVRGLHVPWNLQVIPAEINVRKGNKFTP